MLGEWELLIEHRPVICQLYPVYVGVCFAQIKFICTKSLVIFEHQVPEFTMSFRREFSANLEVVH